MTQPILIPLPDTDFDATEVAVPWRLLTRAGHAVVFATERGGVPPTCDPRTLCGAMFGLFPAAREARGFYEELSRSPEFLAPIAWDSIKPERVAALLLPGGHAPGMRQYLGSRTLQEKVAAFWILERPVAAMCHGVLVLARARDPRTGKSVLASSRTTCLPKYMERTAFLSTAWKLGRYYRTYDAYVEDEVKAALDDPPRQFVRGPRVLDFRRVVTAHPTTSRAVEDGRYVSARWPGDAYVLAERLLARLAKTAARAV